ncbi:MAG: PAS domain-containing protein [Deltaproteobacteria bacterium]|nr:PAS domain-containing protein [Myxococcales bacterium]MDP3215119.1 PAS domain-containing protein [Deltaproteobacteria bacterium]
MNQHDQTLEDLTREVAALRRQDQRLRLILDGVRDHAISMLAPDGTVETFNAPAERIKGYALAEVQGRHYGMFFTPDDQAAGLPGVELDVARATGRYEGEGWRQRKDGSRFYAMVSMSALRGDAGELVGFVKVTQDITERRTLAEEARRARDEAERERARLRQMFHGAPAMISLLSGPELRYEFMSPMAVAATRRPLDEILGRRLDEVPSGVPGSVAEIQETYRRGEALRRAEVPIERDFGRGVETRYFSSVYEPLHDPSGAVDGVLVFSHDVTAHVLARSAVQEANEKLEVVLQGITDGVTMQNPSGRYLFANEAAARIIGVESVAELLEMPPDEFAARFSLFDAGGLPVAPERRPSRRALAGERVSEELLRSRDQRGEERSTIVSATPMFDPDGRLRFVITVFRDVTERRRAEGAARFLSEASTALASSIDYRLTLSTLAKLCVPAIADWATVDMLGPDRTLHRLAVVHVDPAKVELAHELYRRWTPRMDDTIGVPNVLRTGRPEIFYEISDAILESAVTDPELLGILRTLGLSSSMSVPLVVRGRAVGAITLVAAESGRRFAEDSLRLAEELALRASTAIEHATLYREATEASRLKDEFLATVSHELRTPLTAILGWSNILRTRQNDPAHVSKGLETIERNARVQAQLIEDLLDLSRIITGKLRLDVQPIEPGALVETALDSIRPAATAKGLKLRPVIDPHAGPVMGDPGRLVQVVNNLLTNATKFTPKGGSIRVYVRRADSSIEIVVQDNGAGIAPEFLPHVFERFRQADGSITRSQGGLGLGLAICRSLVELHGGTIAADSDGLDRGATFTVRLPVAPLRSSATPSQSGGGDEGERALPEECPVSLKGLSILVVDDEPDTRDLLEVVLRQCEADVRTAGSAAEALEALRRAPPDVLVSDIGMPGEDGLALLRKVRALPREEGGRVPAIALTAYASTGDRTRALMAGFNQFVSKPIENHELVVVIANLMGRFSS